MFKLMLDAIMKLFDIHKLRQSDDCPLNSLQAEYIIKSLEGNTMRIQKVEKLLYVAITLIVLIGCTNLANTTPEIKQALPATTAELITKLKYYNDKYCGVENTLVRETLVTIIRDKFPTYPEGGLCGAEHKFTDVLTNKVPL